MLRGNAGVRSTASAFAFMSVGDHWVAADGSRWLAGATVLGPRPKPACHDDLCVAVSSQTTRRLTRFLLLSIAAAVTTIALKATAWLLTGSVGFLSDAAESIVNLVAAIVALIAVRVAVRPPDDDHAYGHEKAEYFSAG